MSDPCSSQAASTAPPAAEAQRSRLLPERVFVAADCRDDALTKRVLSRLPGIPVTELETALDPLSTGGLENMQGASDAARIATGKRLLLLSRYRGAWIKGCPGTLSHVCCNLWVVNPGEGCPLDCTYCALQYYLRRNPTLKLYTNTGEMTAAIKQRTAAEPGRMFRICTGELTDSLAFDHLTDLSLELVPFFAELPNAVLELKTKDSFVENLLQMETCHAGKTVVSWSVNARHVVEADEAMSAPLEERVAAAQRVAAAGYRIGFHFDPLVYYAGWQEGYFETIRYIFSRVDPRVVAWISIAPLRYHPDQQRIMLERFPQSALPLGEHFLAKDDKLRIFQPIRFAMLSFVWKELKNIRQDMPVYMCMESPAAWRAIAGGPPLAGAELVEIFSRTGRSASGAFRSY